MGNLPAAEKMFLYVHSLTPESPRDLLNRSMLYYSQNLFLRAMDTLTAILERSEDLVDGDADILTSATNNLALCCLYCCDVKRAVRCLEVRHLWLEVLY
jgi:hypothetical protein